MSKIDPRGHIEKITVEMYWVGDAHGEAYMEVFNGESLDEVMMKAIAAAPDEKLFPSSIVYNADRSELAIRVTACKDSAEHIRLWKEG